MMVFFKQHYSKLAFALILTVAAHSAMAKSQLIRKYNTTDLNNYSFVEAKVQAYTTVGSDEVDSPYVLKENLLQKINKTFTEKGLIERFQQKFHGVNVYGAQVTRENNEVNGKLEESIGKDIPVNEIAQYQNQGLMTNAAQQVFSNIQNESYKVKLIVYPLKGKDIEKYTLAYYIQVTGDNSQPTAIVDCKNLKIYKEWNNIKNYGTRGVGGNERTGQYFYGENNNPLLDVTYTTPNSFFMDNGKIRVVDLNHTNGVASNGYEVMGPSFSWEGNYDNVVDYVNGSFNVRNDAYAFAEEIIKMYNAWLKIPCLQDSNGKARKLIMRVHYSELQKKDGEFVYNHNYCNAFWNGLSMTFGDGDGIKWHPFVVLDIAGHEVSHGFTQSHSDLEYHDESGAMNEAFSDIAGAAVCEYVRTSNPDYYLALYPTLKGEVNWSHALTAKCDGVPSRYIDQPALNGRSADCYRQVDGGKISYKDVVDAAKAFSPEESRQQSYIVHMASGIYNRAFYLLAQKWGVENAFRAFALANVKYWTSQENFDSAASGVYNAAIDLKYNAGDVIECFRQVGVYAY
ncbi:MAG: M4 family metallopeptidase [Lentisphaerae bacterium]|nr:M4 family metallopeptidase [Lentisphaerota bacterium]